MTQTPENQQQYGSILTILGENAEQNGKLQNKQITFTHMAIGDANDEYVQPDRKQSALVNELARIPVNSVDVLQPTPDSVPMLKVEAILPDDVNDLVIREFAAVATFDGNTYFHAVGNNARIYVPPPVNNGNVSTPVTLEMIFVITSADPIVEIDPNVVTASREYANNKDKLRQQETLEARILDVSVGSQVDEATAVRFLDKDENNNKVYYLVPPRNGDVEFFDLHKKTIKISGYYSRLNDVKEQNISLSGFQFKPKELQFFDNDLKQEVITEDDAIEDGNSSDLMYYYAPTTAVLPSGRVVIAYTAKYGVDIDPGQVDDAKMSIFVKISDNNGSSFIKRIAVDKPSPYQCSESCILYNHSEKRIYIFYTSFKGKVGWGYSQLGFNEDTSSQIEYVYSDDNGDTWSTPVNITEHIKPDDAYLIFTPPTKAIVNNHGEMMIPIAYTEKLNSSVVETYMYNKNNNWYIGETISKESTSNTGGEVGFGKYANGDVFAISRTWHDNDVLGHRTSIQKLWNRDATGNWIAAGQFETSDCKASWLSVGNNDGFDGFKLLLAAPVGENNQLEGRKNLRLFDATKDFNNPVDLGLLSETIHVFAGYGDLTLLSNGCFLSVFDGRQWRVHMSSFTINKLNGSQGEMVPCHGMKLVNEVNDTLKFDVHEHERVLLGDTDEVYVYRYAKFNNKKISKEKNITSVVTNLNADEADVFYFDSSSAGSIIEQIVNGYIGQTVTLISLSGSTNIELKRLASGSGQHNRIMFNDRSEFNGTAMETYSRLKIVGGTSVLSNKVKLLKTEYGWYSDIPANFN